MARSRLALAGLMLGAAGMFAVMYFSLYHLSGALGGWLPGLLCERRQWPGVVTGCLIVPGAAALVVAARRPATLR